MNNQPISVDYPEHNKLMAISDQSQAIGEFIEWLPTQGLYLGSYDDEADRMYPTSIGITTLLAEFFEIDQDRIEAEKRSMLDILREANS